MIKALRKNVVAEGGDLGRREGLQHPTRPRSAPAATARTQA
jgi:hypothetical protein